jgi:hypothetical protein
MGEMQSALSEAKWLVGNHIGYFSEKFAECDKLLQQATILGEPVSQTSPAPMVTPAVNERLQESWHQLRLL